MTALAMGRKAEAKDLLQRALSLNPKFDLTQAAVAPKALAGM